MVRICILGFGLAFAAVLLIGKAAEAQSADATSVQQSITNERVALRHRHYSQASRTLEDALKRFPGNVQLRLELGRVYAYQRQDSRAKEIFRAVLRHAPSNREAKLEQPRLLSYGNQYHPSNQPLLHLPPT